MKGAIMEGGIPFNRVYGMHAFEYPIVDPRFNDVFNNAMANCTTIVMKRVLEIYEGFEHINKLVDVGGGLGINLKLITSKYPQIHGVNFDLPHVLEHAPSYDGIFSLTFNKLVANSDGIGFCQSLKTSYIDVAGVTHVGGDMFESVPDGDVLFLKVNSSFYINNLFNFSLTFNSSFKRFIF